MSSGDVLALLGITFGSQALWNFLQSLFQKKDPWQELLIGLGHDRITSLCEQEKKTEEAEELTPEQETEQKKIRKHKLKILKRQSRGCLFTFF